MYRDIQIYSYYKAKTVEYFLSHAIVYIYKDETKNKLGYLLICLPISHLNIWFPLNLTSSIKYAT